MLSREDSCTWGSLLNLSHLSHRISDDMWNIFTLMYQTFKTTGIDYLSGKCPTDDPHNCCESFADLFP